MKPLTIQIDFNTIKNVIKDDIIAVLICTNYFGIVYVNYYWIETTPLQHFYARGSIHLALGMLLILRQRQNSYIYKISPWLNGLAYLCCTVDLIFEFKEYFLAFNWPAFRMNTIFECLKVLSELNPIYSSLCVFSVLPFIGIGHAAFKQEKPIKTTHGSAQLMSSAELRKMNQVKGLPIGLITRIEANQPLHDQTKCIEKPHHGQLIRLNPDHVLVVAPSGSGKGVGIVIPTLLDHEGPVVVTDIKAAENYHVTANHRKSLGRTVYAFDPYGLTGQESCAINILEFLNPDDVNFVESVRDIVSTICPLPEHDVGNSRFFAERGAALIQCLILYVVAHPEVSAAEKNLLEVYKLLCQKPCDLKKFLEKISNDDFCKSIPSRLAVNFLTPSKEEFGSTLSTARSALMFIDTPIMHQLTSMTTFDVDALMDNQADLFICIPSEALDTQKRMIQLLLSFIFLQLRKQKTRKDSTILFLIDEMPFLGHITQIEKALLIGRGYGIRIMAIAQTLSSLKQAYPKSWETMLSSNLTLFFGVSDVQTAEYVCKMIGKQTIETSSSNHSKNQGRHSDSTSKATTVNTTTRMILMPEEIMRLPQHLILGFMRAQKPMLLEKICYYTSSHWKNKFDKNPLESKQKDDQVTVTRKN